jgi:CubicO group peptidase (beta-lactamase class C family)
MHMRARWILSALALLCTVSSTMIAQSRRAVSQPKVDAIFSRYSSSTPGCTVGADVNGTPVVRAAYGSADLEHDVPITIDTIFEAGSVSKQFTAAAVLLLARAGKLSLDDPVRKFIPELPDVGATVTLRQMLHHTSGLRDWGAFAALAGWPRTTRVHTHAHVLDLLSRQRSLNFPPGSRHSYTNSGYNLAAIIVERVSGKSFAEFTRAGIFDPLGMKDTSWRDDFTRVVKHRAIAYSERRGTFTLNMPFENVYGNGGLLTTVGDLLKWNANFANPVIGDSAFIAELERRATLPGGRTHEYALGLYVDTYKGVREVDHSGGTAGYTAHLVRYPDQQVSVAVLCNVAGANATAYAKSVAELYLTGLRPATAPPPSHTLTDAEATRLVGLYRSLKPATIAIIERDKDGLVARAVARLVPMSATRFATGDGATYEFDGQGQLRVTDEFGTSDVFDRMDPAQPDLEALKALTGRYVSDEIETVLDVALQGDRLVIRRRPDVVVPLTPVWSNGFSSPLGWVIFARDASGGVVSLSINQERAWDVRFTLETSPGP